MSKNNGDKSRFNRIRKQKTARRLASRQLQQAARPAAAGAAPAEKPEPEKTA